MSDDVAMTFELGVPTVRSRSNVAIDTPMASFEPKEIRAAEGSYLVITNRDGSVVFARGGTIYLNPVVGNHLVTGFTVTNPSRESA